MKLTPEEELFLRRWMYDEVHYEEGQGPAKRLQLQHKSVPADLAVLIAVALPDPATQKMAGEGPPVELPNRPWPNAKALNDRVLEARKILRTRRQEQGDKTISNAGSSEPAA